MNFSSYRKAQEKIRSSERNELFLASKRWYTDVKIMTAADFFEQCSKGVPKKMAAAKRG